MRFSDIMLIVVLAVVLALIIFDTYAFIGGNRPQAELNQKTAETNANIGAPPSTHFSMPTPIENGGKRWSARGE
jgi:hypothetical protein